jgi:hypothetical protein
VRAFIARHPSYLIRFNASSPHPQQATPRTWAALGLALDQAPVALREPLAMGLLGPETGQLFKAFQKRTDAIPTLEELLRNPQAIPVPDKRDLDRAWILATALSDFLVARAEEPRKQALVVGSAVGSVVCRLGQVGFEEVITFAIRRAWRVLEEEGARLGKPPRTQRFLAAITALSADPVFSAFAKAAQELKQPGAA